MALHESTKAITVMIRIVPVAAGLAAAAGLAITGASPASAEATATPSVSAKAYGQARQNLAGEGSAPASPHDGTDPTMPIRDRDVLTGDGAASVPAAASPRVAHLREW